MVIAVRQKEAVNFKEGPACGGKFGWMGGWIDGWK